ncbi:MAG: hypothetical protein JW885_15145 [Deltaproteobacteria bacterium]|nr:hypothetical protein [Candidatus Zymogenaceae bacterium]
MEEPTGPRGKDGGGAGILMRAVEGMTRGVKPERVVREAALLTVFALVAAISYVRYLLDMAVGRGMLGLETASVVFVTDLFLLGVLLFLCALVGLSFAPRYRLPGLGLTKRVVHDLPLLVLGGLALAALTFFLFDRYFYAVSPGSYPVSPLMLISLPMKGAVTDEVILRLGMLTLAVGLLRHRGAGVMLMAALAALMSLRYFQFLGIPIGLNYMMIAHLLISFVGNLALGYLYVHRGLMHAMLLKAVYGSRYLAVAFFLAGGC